MSEAQTIRVGDRDLHISSHAALRLRQRGVSLDSIVSAITVGESFPYFHDGEWKDGFYERESRIFVGVARDTITTVVSGLSRRYIDKLKAGAP
jgi:hypothetical protein